MQPHAAPTKSFQYFIKGIVTIYPLFINTLLKEGYLQTIYWYIKIRVVPPARSGSSNLCREVDSMRLLVDALRPPTWLQAGNADGGTSKKYRYFCLYFFVYGRVRESRTPAAKPPASCTDTINVSDLSQRRSRYTIARR